MAESGEMTGEANPKVVYLAGDIPGDFRPFLAEFCLDKALFNLFVAVVSISRFLSSCLSL